MGTNILDLRGMVEQKLLSRFGNHCGKITICVKEHGRYISMSIRDDFSNLTVQQTLDENVVIECNSLDVFDFYINHMIDDIENEREKIIMAKKRI
jgi:hypothetical protein